MLASKVVIDGELVGNVFVYPFFQRQITSSELGEFKKQLIEMGVNEEDSEIALNATNKINEKEWEYFDINNEFSDEFNKILEKEKDDTSYYCFKKSIK